VTALTRRQIVGLLLLLVIAVIAAVLRLLVYRDLSGVLTWTWPAADVAGLRWTAVAAAAIAGTALAVSGVLLQALLRNPLASPFILGISSGAALGVMTVLYIVHVTGRSWLSAGSDTPPALLGAMITLAVVYLLGQRRGWLDPLSLVLIGVVVSAICGALIMFLQHLVPQGLRGDLVTWMMGHIRQSADGVFLAIAGGLVLIGTIIAVLMGRAMDAATLADDEARSIGLAIGPLRLALFFLAGALTALAVALAGPIGFVGLIAPHAGRLVLGPRHAALVVGAALVGITLLVAGDVVSQAISVGGGRMPVGVFTALIGGPAFIWLLRSGRGQV
jgi:iron complex transport system permease protein